MGVNTTHTNSGEIRISKNFFEFLDTNGMIEAFIDSKKADISGCFISPSAEQIQCMQNALDNKSSTFAAIAGDLPDFGSIQCS